MAMGFEEYVFLVRNLRGVYAPLPSDDHKRYVGWLVKRYRYRDIGVAGCVLGSAEKAFKGRLGGRPFHELKPPTKELGEAIAFAKSVLGGVVDECLAESILLSLVYASPLYLTRSSLEELRRGGLVIHEVRGRVPDLGSARLHMRIAGYTVLDYYVDSVRHAVAAVTQGRWEELLEERRRFAERDEKRYWRITGRGNETIIAYLDHVHVLAAREAAKRLVGEETRVLLAMPSGFVLDPAIEAPKD